MHIGMFIDAYHPCVDGAVTAVDNLSFALEELGHRVTIIAPQFPNYTDPKPEKLVRLPSWNFFLYPPYRVMHPFAWRHIDWDALQLDIIHTHSPLGVARVGLRYAKRNTIPILFTFHTYLPDNLDYNIIGKLLLKKWTTGVMVRYGNNMDTVIAPSYAYKNLFIQAGLTQPVHFLPTGLVLDTFLHGDPAYVYNHHPIKPDEKLFLYTGRLGQEKNLSLMLHSINELRKTDSQFKLIILGGGPEEKKLHDLHKQLQLQDTVIFGGFIDQSLLKHYYKAAYAFLMTSIGDNQPLVLIEAMINHTPVVGVNVLGIPDMITHEKNGLLAEPTISDFTRQLRRILHEPELVQSMQQEAYSYAKALNHLECGKKHIALYKDLLAHPSQQEYV